MISRFSAGFTLSTAGGMDSFPEIAKKELPVEAVVFSIHSLFSCRDWIAALLRCVLCRGGFRWGLRDEWRWLALCVIADRLMRLRMLYRSDRLGHTGQRENSSFRVHLCVN